MERTLEYDILEAMSEVRPEVLNEETLKLYNEIMLLIDERKTLKKQNEFLMNRENKLQTIEQMFENGSVDLEELSELIKENKTIESREDYDAVDKRLAETKKVIDAIYEHLIEGGTYRYLIYDRLGFEPKSGAYVDLINGLYISNVFCELEDLREEVTKIREIKTLARDFINEIYTEAEFASKLDLKKCKICQKYEFSDSMSDQICELCKDETGR